MVNISKVDRFMWEDFEALNHHCGFCGRPYRHPGARTSCFGAHCEPCFRYHQMMFMRGRGHTCDMCKQIDEHHHKRHHAICEQIRTIFGCSGETWSATPEDETGRDPEASGSERSPERPAGNRRTKREKKQEKRLAKAGSRKKVVTQEDVRYVESVLHPPTVQAYTDDPCNTEEIEEIADQLNYKAECYKDDQRRGSERSLLVPGVDIDFRVEIHRIFGILGIDELPKRNEGNRGLHSKMLADFKSHVSDLQKMVVDDLVLAKRDELEISMRKAAFLRYSNRSSNEIVTDRYTERDRKTGEKLRSVDPGSVSTIAGDRDEPDESNDCAHTEQELQTSSSASPMAADRRHTERAHMMLDSRGFAQKVPAVQQIIDNDDIAKRTTPRPPLSLRIVDTKAKLPSPVRYRNPWEPRENGRASIFKAPEPDPGYRNPWEPRENGRASIFKAPGPDPGYPSPAEAMSRLSISSSNDGSRSRDYANSRSSSDFYSSTTDNSPVERVVEPVQFSPDDFPEPSWSSPGSKQVGTPTWVQRNKADEKMASKENKQTEDKAYVNVPVCISN